MQSKWNIQGNFIVRDEYWKQGKRKRAFIFPEAFWAVSWGDRTWRALSPISWQCLWEDSWGEGHKERQKKHAGLPPVPPCLKEMTSHYWLEKVLCKMPVQESKPKTWKKKPKSKNTSKNTKSSQPNKKIDSINILQQSQLPESIMVNRYMVMKTNSCVFFSSRMTLCKVY